MIEGNISNIENTWILIYEMEPKQMVVIDSVKTSGKGEFEIGFPASEHGFYNFIFPDRSMIPVIAGPGDDLGIRADASDIERSYTVTGSEDSELLREFFQYSVSNERKVDSLGRIFEENRGSPDFHIIRGLLDQSFTRIFVDQQEFTREFIRKHPGSLSSLVALYYQLSNNNVLDMVEDIELYELVAANLADEYSSNKHYLHLRKSVDDIREVLVQREIAEKYTSKGMTIPGFEITSLEGKSIRTEDFRGQPLLIYFWASWDSRSRQINRRLKSMVDSFHPQKIQVLAISFDVNPQLWEAAVRIDSLDWNHGSDLLGLSSPVRTLLNIPEKLPYFYLIDPDGTIVYKGNDQSILKKEISDLLSLY